MHPHPARPIVTDTVRVGTAEIGGGRGFALIAGPCVIENDEHPFFMAEQILAITRDLGIPYIFKASFDKANRTAGTSFRGPGLTDGIAILKEVGSRYAIPVTTDVHEAAQAAAIAEAADLLQIPAFLCRQTDLLLETGKTGRAVNIKKGQFLAPWDIAHAVTKVKSTGNENVIVTERGTSFGYNNLVVDFRGFPLMRESGTPLVFDVTHSLQLPGAAGASSSGQSHLIPELGSAGVAAGVDALFMEVHDAPERALSDGPNACPLSALHSLLKRFDAIQKAIEAP